MGFSSRHQLRNAPADRRADRREREPYLAVIHRPLYASLAWARWHPMPTNYLHISLFLFFFYYFNNSQSKYFSTAHPIFIGQQQKKKKEQRQILKFHFPSEERENSKTCAISVFISFPKAFFSFFPIFLFDFNNYDFFFVGEGGETIRKGTTRTTNLKKKKYWDRITFQPHRRRMRAGSR